MSGLSGDGVVGQGKGSSFPPLILWPGAFPDENQELAAESQRTSLLSLFQGQAPYQPDFLQHRWFPDPGFSLVTNIADGHMVSLEPETKWDILNLDDPEKAPLRKD